MFIHSEDNTEVKAKITDEGELLMFCPKCKRIWETELKVIKQPREVRPFKYDGAEIDLDMGSSESVKTKLKTKKPVELAKELFPEAF